VTVTLASDSDIFQVTGTGTIDTSASNYALKVKDNYTGVILNARASTVDLCYSSGSVVINIPASSSLTSSIINAYIRTFIPVFGAAFGTLNLYSLDTTSISTILLLPSITATNLTINKGFWGMTDTITASNLTLQGDNNTLRCVIVTNSTSVARSLIANTSASARNTTFRHVAASGNGWASPTNWIDVGGYFYCTGFPAFTPSKTLYWVATSGGNVNSPSSWSLTSGGVAGTDIPLPQDSVVFDANSITSNGRTITTQVSVALGNINSSALLYTPTLSIDSSLVVTGANNDFSGFGNISSNYINIFSDVDAAIKFNNSSTITSNLHIYLGKPNETQRTLSFLSNLNLSSAFFQFAGNISAGNYNLKCVSFSSSPSYTIGRSYTTTGGILEVTGSGAALTILGGVNYVFQSDLNIIFSSTSSNRVDIDWIDLNFNTPVLPHITVNCVGELYLKENTTNNFYIKLNKLTIKAGRKFSWYGYVSIINSLNLYLGEVINESIQGNNATFRAINGRPILRQYTTNLNKSKPLDFGYCNMTNIAADYKNGVYSIGTLTNCTGVVPKLAKLKGKVFNALPRKNINNINGEDFNNLM
jgi:hypothetical protein